MLASTFDGLGQEIVVLASSDDGTSASTCPGEHIEPEVGHRCSRWLTLARQQPQCILRDLSPLGLKQIVHQLLI